MVIEAYRFGFNGQEKIDEAYGEGNAYDFGARLYDPRIGRWLACDPKGDKYPFLSNYSGMGNNPLIYVDPGGETLKVSIAYQDVFKVQLIRAFGQKANSDFSFDGNGYLQFTGDPNNYPGQEQDLLKGIIELQNRQNVIILIYEKNFSAHDCQRVDYDAVSTDQTGGEATFKPDPSLNNEVHIYIDPSEYAPFEDGVIEKPYYTDESGLGLYKNPLDIRVAKGPGGSKQHPTATYWDVQYSQLSIYQRTFHGLGHALRPWDKSIAMSFENKARAVHKDVQYSITSPGTISITNVKAAPDRARHDPAQHPEFDYHILH